MVITIILLEGGEISFLYDMPEPPHVVVINEHEEWTDSPSVFEYTHEDAQAELIANYRNDGYEDRNP